MIQRQDGSTPLQMQGPGLGREASDFNRPGRVVHRDPFGPIEIGWPACVEFGPGPGGKFIGEAFCVLLPPGGPAGVVVPAEIDPDRTTSLFIGVVPFLK